MHEARFDPPFDRLQSLPRALWLPVLITAVGTPETRLADLPRWRAALTEGELPAPDADFGDALATGALRQVCGELGLAALCRGAPAMAEQLLRTLLWHLDRLIDLQPRRSRDDAVAEIAGLFREAWQQEKGDWDQVLQLLQGLGDLANLRWDELKGLLCSREWAEAERMSRALARLPELVELVRRLGRAERAARPQALPPQPLDAAVRKLLGHKVVETRLPGLPGELRGIRFTDRFENQLGSEAAMLMHPVLHKLWRARRAEARLLGYDSEAVLHDLRPDPATPPRADVAPPRPEALERGPVIVCLDTSGSMRGAPEVIAKAITLEAMRTAQRERRGCLLVAFGGPDEIIERELVFTREGLQALLDLMGQGFDGGTDVQAPIERAIERVHQARWSGADLLIVSDGEFGCVPATLARLDDARERFGLRVQGVLVGDRETLGLMEVADHIHWVRDWRRHGPEPERGSFSPVHSKSLTALYFPGALSGRAARHQR
ncbi:MAG: VWA domain-containing protein [Rubrivivax sp.]